MNGNWKLAALGGLGGAAIAVVIVMILSATGKLPEPQEVSDARMHDYLMRHSDVLVEMSNKLQSDQTAQEDAARQEAVNKLGMKAFFDPRVAFITGPANAKKTVVEFYDYDCPYCRASLPAVKKFYASHKNDTRFAFIELPIASLHGPGAVLAARASLAARRQPARFADFHFLLMSEDAQLSDEMIYADARKAGLNVDQLKQDMMDKSVSAALVATRDLAQAAQINGTPAFIVNGRIREGAINDTILDRLAKEHM